EAGGGDAELARTIVDRSGHPRAALEVERVVLRRRADEVLDAVELDLRPAGGRLPVALVDCRDVERTVDVGHRERVAAAFAVDRDRLAVDGADVVDVEAVVPVAGVDRDRAGRD